MKTLSRAFAAAVLAAAVFPIPTNAGAQAVALTHAIVIDGTGAAPRTNVTIVMESGRIREMGPSGSVAVPAGATVADLTGKFVVPGIINAHGHVGANPDPQLRQYALYGVTTTTSMASDPDSIVQLKAEQNAGNLRGARILTVKHRFQPNPEISTPEQGRAKVDENVAKGADLIKVWIDGGFGTRAKLPPEFSAAVIDQGRKHGKITMAHIYDLADAKFVVDAGVNVLAHNVRDQPVDAALIEALKRRNVTVISTLAREEAMFVYADSPAWVDDPFFRKGVPAERIVTIKGKKRDEQASDPNLARYRQAIEMDKANLKKLSDAGVRIAFGTDSGGAVSRFFVQGFFEHRQMELMVQAGLTPMQVIQSFSKGSSEALGIEKDFGVIARGKAADLLVLEKNPLEDITHMRTIQAVYLGGRKFD